MSYYNKIAEGYNRLHGEEQRRKHSIIKEYIKVKPEDKLLDVGCGSGISKEFFDCDWQGVDPSEELVKLAGQGAIVGYGEELPFQDGEFNIVICVSALHNFEDPLQGLEEIYRVGQDVFAITLFKKGKDSSKFYLLKDKIDSLFELVESIEDDHDLILILRKH